MRKWKVGPWEITDEDVKSFTRFFLAVALIVWAYNLGYNDAMRTVEYVNKVCGPGSAELIGTTAQINITPEGIRVPGPGPIPEPYIPNPLTDINNIEHYSDDGVVR